MARLLNAQRDELLRRMLSDTQLVLFSSNPIQANVSMEADMQ